MSHCQQSDIFFIRLMVIREKQGFTFDKIHDTLVVATVLIIFDNEALY